MLFTHEKYSSLITYAFSKICQLDVVICFIDLSRSVLDVKCGSVMIHCQTALNIQNLNINDKISILCRIALHDTIYGTTCAHILFYYKTKSPLVSKYIIQYNMFATHITNLTHISKAKPIPKIIRNIGIITFDSDPHKSFLNKFLSKFQLKCTGNIFVYNIQGPDNKSELGFINGFNYFQRYHEIDLVCILTDRMTPDQILSLSSKKVLYVILKAKPIPFVISVTNNYNPTYIASIITDLHLTNLTSIISFIHHQQSTYNTLVNNAVEHGLGMLHHVLDRYESQLEFIKSIVVQIQKPIYTDPFQSIRTNILDQLESQKQKLIELELDILHQMQNMSCLQ